MRLSEWLNLGLLVATLSGVAVALHTTTRQIAILKKQLIIQNFAEYTRRYQDLLLMFPEDINVPTFALDGRSDRDKVMRVMRAYFDMCSEEYYLRSHDLIDFRVWQIWQEGMTFAIGKRAFSDAWSKIQKDSQYDSEFRGFVNARTAKSVESRSTED